MSSISYPPNTIAPALTTTATPVITYLHAFVHAHLSTIVFMSTSSAHLFHLSLAVSAPVPVPSFNTNSSPASPLNISLTFHFPAPFTPRSIYTAGYTIILAFASAATAYKREVVR
jgi:hypothetical protein